MMKNIFRRIGFLYFLILALITAIMSFFPPKIFYNKFYSLAWFILIGLTIAGCVFIKNWRISTLHKIFALLILVLAAERSYNHVEYITIPVGSSQKSELLNENISLVNLSLPTKEINNYVSSIQIGDNTEICELSVNHPFHYKKHAIYQYGFDKKDGLRSTFMIRSTKYVTVLLIISILFIIVNILILIKRKKPQDE